MVLFSVWAKWKAGVYSNKSDSVRLFLVDFFFFFFVSYIQHAKQCNETTFSQDLCASQNKAREYMETSTTTQTQDCLKPIRATIYRQCKMCKWSNQKYYRLILLLCSGKISCLCYKYFSQVFDDRIWGIIANLCMSTRILLALVHAVQQCEHLQKIKVLWLM